jgi:hypothetical protein
LMIALTPTPTFGRAFKSLVGNAYSFGKTLLDSFLVMDRHFKHLCLASPPECR